MEKHTKKQVDVSKPWKLSNKIDKLIQIKSLLTQIQLDDLIIGELKEIMQLKNIIKLNELDYKARS